MASHKTNDKFRFLAYRWNSDRFNLPELVLQVTAEAPVELTLENVVIVEPGSETAFLPVFAEKISLNPEFLPGTLVLQQNYPNPFNSQTEIRFFCPEAAKVDLEIFNLLGQNVKTLLWQELVQGWKKVKWDATDAKSVAVPSGIYLFKLKMNEKILTRKLILIR